ncbi:unnamed protein product [Angiostrongylus costaricensis]|uniref:RPOL4c domain-containing protein n=1 Tax=Angiostrongylus costaricensis TaxID=334426 RepID=A0A0R3PZL0_ANGCS|nr:unnamed protein product [Angiostrongylus costaricensis]
MSSAPKKSDEAVDEDATEMRFPKEFESRNCNALLTSEVLLVLEQRRKENEAKDEIDTTSEVFVKTLEYARRFSQFKTRESIKAARAIFSQKPLHKFEVAQIINLCPETAEEAKALIPSLENKLEDDDLAEILKDLHTKKTFQ